MTPAQRAAAVAAAIAIVLPLTMKYEGKENVGYADKLAGGKPTVCYGSTKGVVVGKRYSDDECRRRLYDDANSHGFPVSRCLPDNIPVETLAAMIDTGFNLGTDRFCKSSMSRRAMAGDLKGACDAILLYMYTDGKDCRIAANKCAGIPKRRREMHSLCLQGLA